MKMCQLNIFFLRKTFLSLAFRGKTKFNASFNPLSPPRFMTQFFMGKAPNGESVKI